MTSSGRDWDNSEARIVSRSSSDFVRAESFLLTLRASSDMIITKELMIMVKREGRTSAIAKQLDSSLQPHTLIFFIHHSLSNCITYERTKRFRSC